MDDLERVLCESSADQEIWVLVEGCYSMSGDAPPAAALNALKRRYGFKVLLDQAHSFGVLGEGGRDGDVEADLRLVCFSKFAGLFGGGVIEHRDEYGVGIVASIRPHLSSDSVSYPSSSICCLHQCLDDIERGTIAANAQIVKKLSLHAWDRLNGSGWKMRSNRGSHILIVPIGSLFLACAMQQWCIRRGFYFVLVGHPAVPSKFNLAFRICLNKSMTQADLDGMVHVMNAFARGERTATAARVSEPTEDRRLSGLLAVRNLGGNHISIGRAESVIAESFGFECARYCQDFALSAQFWKKLLREYSDTDVGVFDSFDELAVAHPPPLAAVVRAEPFGSIMLCSKKLWKEEFVILNPSFVFTTGIPPYVWEQNKRSAIAPVGMGRDCDALAVNLCKLERPPPSHSATAIVSGQYIP